MRYASDDPCSGRDSSLDSTASFGSNHGANCGKHKDVATLSPRCGTSHVSRRITGRRLACMRSCHASTVEPEARDVWPCDQRDVTDSNRFDSARACMRGRNERRSGGPSRPMGPGTGTRGCMTRGSRQQPLSSTTRVSQYVCVFSLQYRYLTFHASRSGFTNWVSPTFYLSLIHI